MTPSTERPEEVKIPKSYANMKAKELRHRAGLAWARGKERLAQALEAMALQKRNSGYNSGEHSGLDYAGSQGYFSGEHHVHRSKRNEHNE